jgi:hypothetical protein
MSARTIKLGISDSICPSCAGEGVEPPTFLESRIEVSANGFAQMMVQHCHKHGGVKRLYSARPDAIFKALYPEFFTEEFGEIKPEPKPIKWL